MKYLNLAVNTRFCAFTFLSCDEDHLIQSKAPEQVSAPLAELVDEYFYSLLHLFYLFI